MIALVAGVAFGTLGCPNPVRTRLLRPIPAADAAAGALSEKTPAELLALAAETWRERPPRDRTDDRLRRAITSEIVRRLPEQRAGLERAGLRVSGLPAVPSWQDAERIELSGLSRRFRRSGVGVALSVEGPPLLPAGAAKRPPEGDFAPATAVLTFPAPDCAVLAFVDPRRFDVIETPEGDVPIAADFTAPYARLLATADLLTTGRLALLEAFSEEREGLFLLEPYDPDKTPVVMVHGLASSPLAWRELTNAVFGDAELRRRFQVWHYFYPTGTPYLWAARRFRRTLVDALHGLRVGPEDRAQGDVVLVGHSMGGMLAKTAVSSTGRTLWDRVFEVEPEELRIDDDERRLLEEIFVFEPIPFVRRAVFVMSPHRGSEVAGSWFAEIGTSLVSLPDTYTMVFRDLVRKDPEAVRPEFRVIFEQGGPTSIRALRSDHPLITILADVPVDPDVPFHVVVGDVGDGTDGIVSVESASLPGAATSEVLPVEHTDLEADEVNEAILRVLRTHASDVPAVPRRRFVVDDCGPDAPRSSSGAPWLREMAPPIRMVSSASAG